MLGIRHFQGTAIDLFQGNITDFVCDAIVNAANTKLAGGGGVDGAIHRVGGPTIMQELRQYDGCPTGEARVTGAGKLPARWVIHAVGPVWHGGTHQEDARLRDAYTNSLKEAVKLGAAHIALPSISTGAYRFPLERAAEIALISVKSFLEQPPQNRPRRITFVLFDTKHYQVFRNQLFNLFPEDDT